MIGTIAGPSTSSGPAAGRGLLRLPPFGVERLRDPVVGLGDGVRRLRRRIGDPGLNAVQQVHVRHGIGIVRVELDGDLQHAEAVFDLRPVLRADLLTQCRVRDDARILRLHAGSLPRAGVIGIGRRPIDEANGIVGALVGRVGLNGLQRPRARVVELFRVGVEQHQTLQGLAGCRLPAPERRDTAAGHGRPAYCPRRGQACTPAAECWPAGAWPSDWPVPP